MLGPTFENPPCRGLTDLFFSYEQEDQRRAVAICTSDCDQRKECLAWALRTKPVGGVWGGVVFDRSQSTNARRAQRVLEALTS